ncbi:hypothetical protein [Haloferula sp. BvORR071]|uniref:hypothetical protein n=1 Tax=Haloferula sp. BvORR071 TaxID=1396141 RepID=UPI00054DC183|nr:hypothetical protein [Haloferula sp. BvORR071]
MTRRQFLKRTGGATVVTVVAWNSLAAAGTTPPPAPSSGDVWTVEWVLRCVADPYSGKPNEGPLREDLGGSAGYHGWSNYDDTPFDPVGPGNSDNCKLEAKISASGPKQSDEATKFTVTASMTASMTIRGTHYITAGPPGATGDGEKKLEVEQLSTSVTIDRNTGVTFTTPADGSADDDDECMGDMGRTVASLKNSTAFTVEAELTHDFRSAYQGSAGVSLKFKDVVGIDAGVQVNVNDLKDFKVTPSELSWTIIKVKKFKKNGNVMRTELYPLASGS